MFWIKEKFVSLHRKTEMKCSIGLWCNGNTTDSGPVILGSSPSTPTFINDCFTKSKTVVLFLSEKRGSPTLGQPYRYRPSGFQESYNSYIV